MKIMFLKEKKKSNHIDEEGELNPAAAAAATSAQPETFLI